MASFGSLQFDDTSFDLTEANIYGIFEPHGNMTWHIEIFPANEDNYIMFNALIFEDVFSPRQLSEVKFFAAAGSGDLYEHTIFVNGEDRFLKSVDMTFNKWDATNQSIELIGHGVIQEDGDLPEVSYKFVALLEFKDIFIFETSHNATIQFVETYFTHIKDKLEISFENVASGLKATIKGQF